MLLFAMGIIVGLLVALIIDMIDHRINDNYPGPTYAEAGSRIEKES